MKRLRASALCYSEDFWLLVRLRDTASGKVHLLPPGGEIQLGETPANAAAREFFEETGFTVDLEPKTKLTIDYDFLWMGKTFACQTHFFMGKLRGSRQQTPAPNPDREKYIEGVEWVSTEHLLEILAPYQELGPKLSQWVSKNFKTRS